MNIHEYQGKELFRKYGIPVPKGVPAFDVASAHKAAEQLIQTVAAEVNRLSGTLPVLYLREGERRDQLLKLIDEEPGISILVLAAAAGQKGPGPLISALTGKFLSRLRVPITIVPGGLSDEDIESIS